jgi:hypothetical protein
VVVRLLSRRKRAAFRPIGEAEAYARCHGDRSTDIISVDPMPQPEPEPPRDAVTGETLRQAFELRLRSRSRST